MSLLDELKAVQRDIAAQQEAQNAPIGATVPDHSDTPLEERIPLLVDALIEVLEAR